jgi:Glycosyl transferases group 1
VTRDRVQRHDRGTATYDDRYDWSRVARSLSRKELVTLLCSAKICVNPHALSQTPGNVFAFKIIEYLSAGARVVSTRMGVLEPEIEAGITYISDNQPETIVAALKQVIVERRYRYQTKHGAQARYGRMPVSEAIEALIQEVAASQASQFTSVKKGGAW